MVQIRYRVPHLQLQRVEDYLAAARAHGVARKGHRLRPAAHGSRRRDGVLAGVLRKRAVQRAARYAACCAVCSAPCQAGTSGSGKSPVARSRRAHTCVPSPSSSRVVLVVVVVICIHIYSSRGYIYTYSSSYITYVKHYVIIYVIQICRRGPYLRPRALARPGRDTAARTFSGTGGRTKERS